MAAASDSHGAATADLAYRRIRRGPPRTLAGIALSAASLLLVLVFLAVALGQSQPGLSGGVTSFVVRGSAPALTDGAAVGTRAAIHPAAIATTTIYVNRSQSAGTYVNEYVSLNNSSTLTKIPATLTVVASSCRWVTILNATVKVDSFHSILYGSVSVGNATGTLYAGAGKSSYKICGGSASFVNYVLWTYSIYTFTAPTLGNTVTSGAGTVGLGNLTLVYETPTGYAGAAQVWLNKSYAFDVNHAVQIKIPINVSFQVSVPTTINQATTCDVTGQICNYQSWGLVSSTQAGTTNTTTKGALTFAQPLSAAYVNWSSSYKSTNVSSNSAIGGAWVAFANWVFAWWLALLILFVLVIIGLAYYERDGRHRRRRE